MRIPKNTHFLPQDVQVQLGNLKFSGLYPPTELSWISRQFLHGFKF